MNYSEIEIVLQEVPGEISICFSITGCGVQCKGCHSSFLWNKHNGTKLTEEVYKSILTKYNGFASCVLFMGGEWCLNELTNYFKIAKNLGFKTCLYTGETEIPKKLKVELTYLKTGPWVESLGGLNSKKTNQKFIEVQTNQILNHLFLKN
ncbi:anaerobic ribonucleoside-triphosphate reductase activating protein [Lutibacter holmesii]|uniref:Anaerobic ribonucleoside-triphosphate reductase activating protein n=1 Tax=Lutibacter holmesii TaxID=1137985 RepID=A0ABW3WKW0_9FLAO